MRWLPGLACSPRWIWRASVRRCVGCCCARPGILPGVAPPVCGSGPAWPGSGRWPRPAGWARRRRRPFPPGTISGSLTGPGTAILRSSPSGRRYLAAARLSRRRLAGWCGRRRGRRQGGAGRGLRARRARADQLPAHQPGGDQDGRWRPAAPAWRPGARNFVDDLLRNGGRPAPGRYERLQDRRESRGHAGQGRVQERADGAHSVRAADAQGPRGPDAGQPAVDQQVLHHGPGPRPQLHRVGGPARAHGLRHLLPQPRRLDARRDPGRLPDPRPPRGPRRHRRTSPAPRRSTSPACAWAAP